MNLAAMGLEGSLGEPRGHGQPQRDARHGVQAAERGSLGPFWPLLGARAKLMELSHDPLALRLPGRRAFLHASLCAAAHAGTRQKAHAQNPGLQTDLPQLRYPGNWSPYPKVMQSMGSLLRLRTRIEATRDPSVVQLPTQASAAQRRKLFATPFLYIAGQDKVPVPQGLAAQDLRRFVDFGGLLIFDDASGGRSRAFRKSVQAWIASLFPSSKLTKVPENHVLYRSFYVIKHPAGRSAASDHCLAVQEEGRLKVLYLPNDLGGALARSPGGYLMPCAPGGEVQREWAQRFAVNLLLYATCTDYKSDPAHVETLLRRRRWQ